MARVSQPRPDEPIRLVETQRGVRYRAVVTTSQPGTKREQATSTHDTLTAARAWVDETRANVRSGAYVRESKVTVAEMCDRWLTTTISTAVAAQELRQVTADSYTRSLLPARRYFDGTRLSAVRHSDVEAFKSWLLSVGNRWGRGYSPRSVSLTLECLQRVFTLAMLDGEVRANPCTHVRRSNKRSKPAAHWTPEQLDTFRRHADEDPLAEPLRLILCGLRRSEVLGFAWHRFDASEGIVAVRQGRVPLADGSTVIGPPKSEASTRDVWVDAVWPGTSEMLVRLRERQASDPLIGLAHVAEGLVVLDAVGEPLRPELLSDRFAQIARKAGLPPIKMHEVRHSIATALANDPNVDDAAAAEMLGHDPITFRSIYAQRTGVGSKRAAQALGASLLAAAAE